MLNFINGFKRRYGRKGVNAFQEQLSDQDTPVEVVLTRKGSINYTPFLKALEAVPILTWKNVNSGNVLDLFLGDTKTILKDQGAYSGCCGRYHRERFSSLEIPPRFYRQSGIIYSSINDTPKSPKQDVAYIILKMGKSYITYYWAKNVKVDIHCKEDERVVKMAL